MKLKITINDNVLTATLNGSQASREFAGLLPLTLQLSDYAGEEKKGDLPARLSTADSPVGSAASKGDIMVFLPWGNLAIFIRLMVTLTGSSLWGGWMNLTHYLCSLHHTRHDSN
jgi:hypothetical protein